MKKYIFVFAVSLLLSGCSSPTDDTKEEVSVSKSSESTVIETEIITEDTEKEEEIVVKEEKVPREHASALKKAESYAKTMSMSKAAIYDQLTSEYGEKFSEEAAQYAMDHLEADFNENALKKAESYQDSMSMSPEAIRDQLTSEHGEQFTQEEADYALEHLEE